MSDQAVIPKAELKPKKNRGNPPWNWFQALCVGLLALVGMDVFLGLLLSLLGTGLKGTPLDITNFVSQLSANSISANFGYYAVSRLLGFGFIWLFIHSRGVSLRKFGFKPFAVKKAIGYIAAALGLMVAATLAVFAIISIITPDVNLDQAQDVVFTKATAWPEIVLAFVALIIIAPIVEESIFRGLMLPAFAKKFGIVVAAIVTSILFGAVHGQLNVGIVTFILGLLLAWVYYKTRSLWPAIILHSLKNLIAFILIFHKL